uniref:Putative RuBisCO transcriptional regulator n=1 Tax=Streptomyces citricolor TaxID=212427 RepID=A0A7R6FI50_9ACTN|nr:putative RuBisCO transcriptional regulator [Streptomyces citricolor]
MDLDPRRLLVLHAIAHHGGLAPAARALGQTRSAVSQQLARLEKEVGLPLVDRSGNRLELTATGRLLAATGDRIGRELAAAAEKLNSAGGPLEGPVVIGASSWVLARLAVALVGVLAERHPRITPRFVETGLPEGLHRLRLGELDVLVVSDDRQTAVPLPPSVRARVLIEDTYRLVVPDGWAMPSGPAELSGRPWLSAPAHTARGRAFARFAAAHGIVPSLEHLAEHPGAVQALLAGQLGAVIMPAYFAAQLERAKVTGIPVPGSLIARVLHRTGTAGGAPAARAVVAALLQAGRDHAEQEALDGRAVREAVIRPLRDPSEDASPASPGRG